MSIEKAFRAYLEPRGNRLTLKDLDEFGGNQSVALNISNPSGQLSPYGATFDLTPSQQRDLVIDLVNHLMDTDRDMVLDIFDYVKDVL